MKLKENKKINKKVSINWFVVFVASQIYLVNLARQMTAIHSEPPHQTVENQLQKRKSVLPLHFLTFVKILKSVLAKSTQIYLFIIQKLSIILRLFSNFLNGVIVLCMFVSSLDFLYAESLPFWVENKKKLFGC